jgi:ribosomal protein S18 acetylase RimI-like enzyme
MSIDLILKIKEFNKEELCNNILRSLPEWFGIEEAIVNYTNEISDMTTLVAIQNDIEVGFISLNEHNNNSAEIHVMGILPANHRQGIGHKLVKRAEDYLKEKGIKFFTVKTLSPSRECEEYRKTRLFYKSVGFVELEEFKTLWGEENPCLMMIKPLSS